LGECLGLRKDSVRLTSSGIVFPFAINQTIRFEGTFARNIRRENHMTRILSIVLAFAASIFHASAQADKNASAPPTLPELAVEAKPIKELNWGGSAPIDGSQVENRGIGTISDLSGIAPNFHVNANSIQSYGDIITMRGIANTQLFGAPGVILYIDGVPAGSATTYSSTLFDVESVEVLRGFQGHRFGKNAPGGVINVKTRRPGDTHRSKLFASYGTFDTQNYRILADGPTSNSSSYYFGLNRSSSDGFADNLNTLGNDATSESLNGRLGFNWVTEGGLEIGLGGTWEEFNLGAQPIVPRANGGNPSFTSFYNRNSALKEISKIELNSQYLSLTGDTNLGRIKSTTSRNSWEINPNVLNLSYVDSQLAELAANRALLSMPELTSTSTIIEERTNWSEELSLTSDSDEDTIWEIGLIFNSRDVDGQANRLIPMAADLNPFNMAGYKLESSDTTYNSSEKTYGIRGKVIKELLNNSFLEAGLRMDFSQKKLNRSKSNSHLLLPAVEPTNLEENFEWASGFLGITHPMSDTFAFTINSSFSAKPGGFSAYLDPGSALSEKFSKEKSWQNELGLNLTPSDTFGINITGFWNEIDDYQVELPVPLSTDYYVANADEVSTKGIEIEAFFKPMEELTLSAAYGLTESEYEKFDSLSTLVGKKVSFVPEHTLSLSLAYENDNGLSGHLGSRTIGKTNYWNNTGTNIADIQDTYTLLDASIGFERNGWGVGVFGTNLTNEEYYSTLVSSLGGSPGVVGSPRVIGLSISKEF